MTDILEIVETAQREIREALAELPKVNTRELGLDERAGRVWVDVDNGLIIAGSANARSLDYYGGFEYVDEGAVTEFAGYKIYDTYDDRVSEALDAYEG